MATILLQLPTRSRPEKAEKVLGGFFKLASGQHTLLRNITLDDDDLASVEWFALDEPTIMPRHSKIAACNNLGPYDAADCDWDIVVLISDDMTPVLRNWDQAVVDEMAKSESGCLHFDDGHTGSKLCTLPIMSRDAWQKAGRVIYNPEYLSLWCDNEWTEFHKPRYVPHVLARHDHPHWGVGEQDELYRHNESLDAIDRATYRRRKALGFPHPSLQPWLTVGVCHLPERKELLQRLLVSLGAHVGVEVLLDDRPRPLTTGAKRQALLDRANGKYIMFVDDDDMLAAGAIGQIGKILLEHSPDAIGFNGLMYTDGALAEGFTIEHTEHRFVWEKRDGHFYRGINHLSPVRIDLARRTGFKDQTFAEDHDYAKRLHPLLKRCSHIPSQLYFYFFNSKKTKVVGEVEGVVELSRDKRTKFVRIPKNQWSPGQRVQVAAIQGGK